MGNIEESGDPMAEDGRLAETPDPLFEEVVRIVEEVLMGPIPEGTDPVNVASVRASYRSLAGKIETQARRMLCINADSLVDTSKLLAKVREVAEQTKARMLQSGR